MTYTITEAVHVDIRIDGEDLSLDYAPGDTDLPAPVAELLVAQGLATVTPDKGGKKTKAADDTPAATDSTITEA